MELRGRTILITRAASQSEELRAGLEAAGARVIERPAIEIVPVEDWTQVDRAASNLPDYDWLIFTSSNAVELFMRRLQVLGLTCSTPIAVVGAGTAGTLGTWNLTPTCVPHNFRAEGLLEAFPADLPGVRILIPRAEIGRELLPEELRKRGAAVDVLTVYRTVKASGLTDLRTSLRDEQIDIVVFTSPSAVRYFGEELGGDLVSYLRNIPIAVIGPVTGEAVRAAGLETFLEPERSTIQDLIQSIRSYFSSRKGNT